MADISYDELYNNMYLAKKASSVCSIANIPIQKDELANSNYVVEIDLNQYPTARGIFEVDTQLPFGVYTLVIRAKRLNKSNSNEGAFQIKIKSSEETITEIIRKKDFSDTYNTIAINFSTMNNTNKEVAIMIETHGGDTITDDDIYSFDDFVLYPNTTSMVLQGANLNVDIIQKRAE